MQHANSTGYDSMTNVKDGDRWAIVFYIHASVFDFSSSLMSH